VKVDRFLVNLTKIRQRVVHRVQTGSGVYRASYPMGTWGSFPGVQKPGCEADHSPPSNAEVKEWVELYLYSPNTPSQRGAQLKNAREQLDLYFYIYAYSPFFYTNFNVSSSNYMCSYLPMRAACPTHLVLRDLITLVICGEEFKLWGPHWYFYPASSCFFSPRSKYSPQIVFVS